MTIGIFHRDLENLGGAEAVAANTIQALQDKFQLKIFTSAFAGCHRINEFYNTSISPENIDVCKIDTSILKAFRWLSEETGRMDRAYRSFFTRKIRRSIIHSNLELVISTDNEFPLDLQAIQYIHYPQLGNKHQDQTLARRVYHYICRKMSGEKEDWHRNSTFVTNSEYTKRAINESYRFDSEVVYPPTSPNLFSCPWNQRETGFLIIGRISPEKSVHMAIDILEEVQFDEDNVHLHIIGPPSDQEYFNYISERASNHTWIHIEGEISRERLKNMMATHKFGIHCNEREHFGITVAEMVQSGMVPFVPVTGGPKEIIQEPELLYNGECDCKQKIKDLMNDRGRQRELHETLYSSSDRFSRERFQNSVLRLVENNIKDSS